MGNKGSKSRKVSRDRASTSPNKSKKKQKVSKQKDKKDVLIRSKKTESTSPINKIIVSSAALKSIEISVNNEALTSTNEHTAPKPLTLTERASNLRISAVVSKNKTAKLLTMRKSASKRLSLSDTKDLHKTIGYYTSKIQTMEQTENGSPLPSIVEMEEEQKFDLPKSTNKPENNMKEKMEKNKAESDKEEESDTEESEDENMEFNADKYNERLQKLLILRDEKKKKTKWDWHSVITSFYGTDDLNRFLNDYHQFATRMDVNNLYIANHGKCSFSTCKSVQRAFRNRKKYDLNKKHRYKLYDECSDEREICLYQIMDQIHISMHHLIDMGYRHLPLQNDDDEKDKNAQLQARKAKLLKKKATFEKIRNDSNDDAKSKFVTSIDRKSTNDYKFGVRFYYHSYYQNKHLTEEQVPGASIGCIDYGNDNEDTFSFWYISPRHQSLKAEVLNAEKDKLSIIEYENTLNKASIKLKALQSHIKGAAVEWEIVYNVQRGSPISLNHVLSLLFYCNFPTFSYQFRRSFKKINANESNDVLKSRHSKFYHLAKYLREIVDCFGFYFDETPNIKIFYHCIQNSPLFNAFSERFHAPTSTSLRMETAEMFAGDGVVISIKNDCEATQFFDCTSWSDFGAFECERLFIGGFTRLEFCGLSVIGDGINYDVEIQAMKLFQTGFIDGSASTDQMLPTHQQTISALIDGVINGSTQNESGKSSATYIQKLFKNILNNTDMITIDFAVLNTDICYKYSNGDCMYGFRAIKDLYLKNDGGIRLDMIKKLFPSLTTIYIACTEKIQDKVNGFKMAESMNVNDEFIVDVFSWLCQEDNTWKWIDIGHPKNSMEELYGIIKKYSPQYAEPGFMFDIEYNDHPRFGEIYSLCINPL